MKHTLRIFVIIASLATAGCAIRTGAAGEIRQKISVPPFFSSDAKAIGIKKEVTPDGNEVYKADDASHNLTIGIFQRDVTYKDVILEVKPKDKP